jgi:hypothetical protein
MKINKNEDQHQWESIVFSASRVGNEPIAQGWIWKLLNFESDREITALATERVIAF